MTRRAPALRPPRTISIHIPRVGDDRPDEVIHVAINPISIHIPRVGDDVRFQRFRHIRLRFQSTSPVWGMTEGQLRDCYAFAISIHIPRVGDDAALFELMLVDRDFNPHPPCGG